MSSSPPASPNPNILAQIRAQRSKPLGGHVPDSKPPWKVTFRRFLAFFIDHVVFFAVGFLIINFGNFSFLERLGIDGWWVGLVLTTIYFTILDSSVGGGRTFGKRLLKIEARHLSGLYLHPVEALVRYSPFIAITVLTNELRCANQVSAVIQALDILLLLISLAIPVLMIAHPLRRSIQDLISGSIVVLSGTEIQIPDVSNRKPLIVIAIVSGCVGALSAVFFWSVMTHPLGKEFGQLYEVIEKRPDICCSYMSIRSFPDADLKPARSLVINTYPTKSADLRKEPEMARQIYDSLPRSLSITKNTTQVAVTFLRGYDIGIYRKMRYSTHRFPALSRRIGDDRGGNSSNIHYKVTPSTMQKNRMQKQAMPQPKDAPQNGKK